MFLALTVFFVVAVVVAVTMALSYVVDKYNHKTE